MKREFDLNLSKYATKSDLKYLAGVDASDFAKYVDLASSNKMLIN